MAVFQNVLSFFQPTPRRGGAAGGRAGVYDAATQRVIAGMEGVLEPFNAADYITDYLKEDLQDAFTIKGPPRPGYEPGRVAPVRVNLVDFVTDPLKTTWKTATKPFGTKFSDFVYTPDDFLSQVDEAVWEYLYTQEWKGVVPNSVQAAVARWNERKGVRITRHLAAQAVRENPGTTFMMAKNLESVNPSLVLDLGGGKSMPIDSLKRTAVFHQQSITAALAKGDWAEADRLQKVWNSKYGKSAKKASDEFKNLARKGGPLYNTPEAQHMRYWEARNLRYATLNLLRTYKEDGFWGAAKVYGWDWATNKAKDFYFASRINALVNNVAAKLGIKKLFGKLADAQTYIKKLRAGFWLKKGMKRAGGWLVKKLGLARLGALLGSALPGAGTAIGAVLGAVIQFVGEIVLEKLGGPLKVVGYVLAGVIGFFGLFAVGIVVLVSTILGNHPYPWEAKAKDIDCDQSATAVSSCVASKAVVKNLADRWGVGPGNHVDECYNDVIAKSKAAGEDPRVVMAIWVHESNASNYDMYEGLGEPPQDFGIPSQAGEGFTVQINSFLNFYKSTRTRFPACYSGRSDAEGLFRAFCTAGREAFGVGQCPDLTDAGEACVASYFVAYNVINTGGTCD